jgi:hypothetical protein
MVSDDFNRNAIDLFTQKQKDLLFANANSAEAKELQVPVAYLRIRNLGYRFLVTQLDVQNPDVFYGLCDFDTDIKVQYYSLTLLKRMAAEKGDHLVAKPDFKASHSLDVFTKVARHFGTVLVDDSDKDYEALFRQFSPA